MASYVDVAPRPGCQGEVGPGLAAAVVGIDTLSAAFMQRQLAALPRYGAASAA